MLAKFDNWSVVNYAGAACLYGIVVRHPRLHKGGRALSSPIVSFNIHSEIVQTQSGTIYELGKPCQEYLNWIASRRLEVGNPWLISLADKYTEKV